MSRISDQKPLTADQESHKAAFGRAVRMAGGGSRMAASLGVEPGTVTRWERMNYNDCPPGHLYNRIDAAAGYPCMLECIAVLAGYSVRRDDVEKVEANVLSSLSDFAQSSGGFAAAVLEAKADNHICLRELNLIEAEGNTCIANVTRTVEAARAKYAAGQNASVVPMGRAAR